MKSKKNLLASTIAFFVGVGGVNAGFAQESVGGDSGYLLEEVIVTASKRGAGVSIQDTPMSITALSADTIEKRSLLELNDFVNGIVGVTLQNSEAGDKRIFIRGLAITADTSTSVSTYLGEIPLSSAGLGAVNLRLVDIERIEALKGPQGTLYGSGASSGTLRYIPVAPSLDAIEGSLEVNVATLEESDDTSQSFTGVINTPLIKDTLALRVAAYQFEDAGYVDAVSTSGVEAAAVATGVPARVEDDINSGETSGIRANLLWQASDDLDINFTIGAQRQEYDGYARTNLDLGGYNYAALDTGDFAKNDVDYANLTANYNMEWAVLTSSTSVLEHNTATSNSGTFVGTGRAIAAASFDGTLETEIMAQEIRLSSELEGPLQFLAGLYYEDVQSDSTLIAPWHGTTGVNPYADNPIPGVWFANYTETSYQQQAVFGELYYQLAEEWELSMGARHFDYDREDNSNNYSFDEDGSPLFRLVDASKKDQTYKVGINYTPSDNTLLFAQWSEGFRLGKGQAEPPSDVCDLDNNGEIDGAPGAQITDEIKPDTTENFELGAKLSLLDSRLTLNTAIYHITWSDLPSSYKDPDINICTVVNNVAEAKSKGVEVELAYLVSESLKMEVSVAYNEAVVSKTTPSSNLTVGEDLPFAPYITAGLGLEYNFDVSEFPAYIRTDVNYLGEAEANRKDLMRPKIGDYVDVGLRLGVNIDQWDLAFYSSNLLNKDSVLAIDNENHANSRLRPRKLGFEAKYNF